jgi:amino acid transporter
MFATALLIAALVLFILAACSVPMGRFNPTAGGLACWVAATLLPRVM